MTQPQQSEQSEELLRLLALLVQTESTSGTPGEIAALRLVHDWMVEACGEHADVSLLADDGQPRSLLITPRNGTRARETEASITGHSPHRKLLLFSGHVDTVPTGDEDAWEGEPRSAEIRDGRMFGRGTSDMKSGLAASMLAVVTLLRESAPVALLVSTGEELGCLGVQTALEAVRGLEIGAVIVPESTENEIMLGHRGALWVRGVADGVAAHGSTPERGVNAIARAMSVLARLEEAPLHSHPELGRESVNLGVIRGGEVPNIVPERCEFEVDVRMVDDDAARILDWWRSHEAIERLEVTLDLAPVWTPVDHPWVASLQPSAAAGPVSYFTDASRLVRVLPAGTPVVIWGPGDPSTVHALNESVDLTLVEDALSLYLSAGRDWRARCSPCSPDCTVS
ncbi:M20/M25/M40 family metallo-hydrolase [Humidisolicoccus flavus]|uniref:M20/M25/M40 family metallo-hydrolase n=1 Tax=Humidisolicoccus flavus TaxID=3111414 RepID=UPI00324AE7E1